jgi:hypothetical protein
MNDEIEKVAMDLAKHEAVCAERWKTAFNRFDSLDTQVQRIEEIIMYCAGGTILFLGGLIVTLVTLHS